MTCRVRDRLRYQTKTPCYCALGIYHSIIISRLQARCKMTSTSSRLRRCQHPILTQSNVDAGPIIASVLRIFDDRIIRCTRRSPDSGRAVVGAGHDLVYIVAFINVNDRLQQERVRTDLVVSPIHRTQFPAMPLLSDFQPLDDAFLHRALRQVISRVLSRRPGIERSRPASATDVLFAW
jgi:hypothetical protein